MRWTWIAIGAAAAMTAACSPKPAADPADLHAYAITMPVVPANTAPLQRLSLPPEILTALQRPDLADLRIFDGKGHILPMANAPANPSSERHEIMIPALPILGAPGSLKVTGISLKVDDRQQARIVRVDGTPDAADTGKAAVLGALVDTRAIADPVAGILIDADLPEQQPVTFDIAVSTDLKHWRPLAQKVIYRGGKAAGSLGPETITVDRANLRDSYLRIIWSADSRLLAPVTIKNVRLETLRQGAGDRRPAIDTSPPTLVSPHEVRFSLPFATPVAALKIVPAEPNALIPIRLLGRNDRERPWTPVASGTISTIAGRDSTKIDVGATTFRMFKIEADARTSGFSAAPHLQLQFEPVEILAVFDGAGPFTLAAGSPTAGNTYLPEKDIMPDDRRDAEAAVPMATVGDPRRAPPVLTLPTSTTGDGRRRDIILWALLLAGTAVLAAMVWVLWRKPSR